MELVSPVEINLDKTRKLRFDMNAMASFERISGKNIRKLDYDNLDVADIRALVWACLLDDDPAITPEIVGHAITPANFDDVTTKLLEAINASIPPRKANLPQT